MSWRFLLWFGRRVSTCWFAGALVVDAQDHRCSTMKWDRDPPGKTTMIPLELPRSHHQGRVFFWVILAPNQKGCSECTFEVFRSEISCGPYSLWMPGWRCRWCSNPDKIYMDPGFLGGSRSWSLDFPPGCGAELCAFERWKTAPWAKLEGSAVSFWGVSGWVHLTDPVDGKWISWT